MRWSGDGRSAWVGQESEFPPTILDQLSARSQQNFIRQLYYHDFRKPGGAYVVRTNGAQARQEDPKVEIRGQWNRLMWQLPV